ncbi:MAG: UvrD-helicase domain-containing protein [Bacteroidetes bacterium]|jgi:ATP-dependent exoDNAse (exonuclease V) beta subunit|nr:UvrD-helicase domain-containing protein [Bacteroidota bacterium]
MAHLSVVKASAGSGKTFKLTLEYLKLLFIKPDVYRNILAVTFTNKATYEMKDRILKELNRLAKMEPTPYAGILSADLNSSEEAIRQKAEHILERILHDYSKFSIETIDSFFQRLIRAFTREMGLNAGYRVELNTSEVLEAGVNRLLLRMDEDENLRNWLTQFAGEKILEGKSWNIRDNIKSLGRELFNEAYKLKSVQLQKIISEPGFIKKYQFELLTIIKKFETNLAKWGAEAVTRIEDQGLSIDDFSFKKNGVAGFFVKIQNKDFEIKQRVSDALKDPDKWYSKSSGKKAQIDSLVKGYLLDHLQQIVDFIFRHGAAYYTAKTISENLYTLGILNDLSEEVMNYCRDEDLFLISDSAFFLNGIIGNNDTPFIYEKVGNYYHHFMIDEFQDTSEIQYQNFKPLLANSLAENKKNFLVGDVKQSIYRWRNTNWEVFEKQVKTDFIQQIQEYSLGKNWRSLPNIVNFNNKLFEQLPVILQEHYNNQTDSPIDDEVRLEGWDDMIRSVYKEVFQEPAGQIKHKPDAGYVEICTDELEEDQVLEKMVADIKKLQDTGYRAGDIAILVRKSKQAKEVVQYLLEQSQESDKYNLAVVSNEALLINYSNSVNLIIDTLHYLVYPEDDINTFELAYYYHLLGDDPDKATLKNPLTTINFNSHPLHTFISKHVLNKITGLKQYTLFEIIEQVIAIFKLYHIANDRLYLNRLLDVSLAFQERYGSDIYLFLEYWAAEKSNLSVNPSGSQDAIQVLTIHKAKGLEFKTVLIPFCDWALDHKRNDVIQWCKTQQQPFDQLPLVPIRYASSLKQTYFVKDYYHEMVKTFIDNLNLLYVACTRASEALIITASQSAGAKISHIGHLLFGGCQALTRQDEITCDQEFAVFTCGNIRSQSSDGVLDYGVDEFSEFYTSQSWQDKIKIAFQGNDFFDSFKQDGRDQVRTYGQLMHAIFSGINNLNEVEQSVNEEYFTGKISKHERDAYIREIGQKINGNQLIKEWFAPGQKIYTERTIYLKNGEKYRPDRVIWNEDGMMVVDYKFGENPSSNDIEQVKHYLKLVEEMEEKPATGYIWYYHLDKVEKVEAQTTERGQLTLW